jgi:hypothetical protein
VIAMFDPDYNQQPGAAEQRVEAVLRPPAPVHAKSRTTATLRMASYHKHPAKAHGKKAVKRKLT